jgi:macrolide-specific efflux system membrane fusion protein
VTVTIESRSNVLVVPNRALSKSAGIYTVQVVDGDKTETRQVTVGLADSSYTEITSGLSEGEIVVVKTSSSTSSSGMMMPGSGSVVVREVTR